MQGVGVDELGIAVKPHFEDVRRHSPHASRNSSSEVYLICRRYQPWAVADVNISDTYEFELNKKLSGEDIADGPEIIQSSFSVRKKKTD